MPTNQQRREAVKRKLERQQERRVENTRKRKRITVITAIVTVVATVAIVLALTTLARGKDETPAAPSDTLQIPTELAPPPKRPTALPATVPCAYPAAPPAAKAASAPATANVSTTGTVAVTLNTTAGEIGLVLDRSLAPCSVNSFTSLVSQGYFDATTCHRLTTSPELQVLQCGDPNAKGDGGPGYTIADETYPGISYGRGYLALANSGPNTSGSQFFMVYGTAELQPNFTVLGTITAEGLTVLDAVARKGLDPARLTRPGDGKPAAEVRIDKAAMSG